MKHKKMLLGLVLTLAMLAALAVTAYAASVTVKYRVYVYSDEITFRQYDYSQSTTPSITNLTISATSSLGSGSALYHMKYADGAVAYCIEPGAHSDDSGTYKVPKVVFNLAELVGAENLNKIKSISCDITGVAVGMFTGDDGSEMLVPGNVMGALGGNLAAEKKTDADGGLLQNTWANLTEFSFAEWENNWVYSHVEANILLDANRYEAGYDGATLVLMRWGIPNQADLYIDNITFYDEDGKSIPLAYTPAGAGAGADSSKAE